ncbi:hypothetical protein MMC08_008038 [Hypocenomyce scalaris]|nr:hypothetical protein [Hypocenomyce scalaris]
MARITQVGTPTTDRKIPTSSAIPSKQTSSSPDDHRSPSKSTSPATQAHRDMEPVPDRTGMYEIHPTFSSHKVFISTKLTELRRFNSSIFTILVSESKHVFTAHETVLSQSPVLARFCKSNFKEATTKEITLPDESVESVGRLLEYLYSGDYACAATQKTFDEAVELAGMYIIGDKYNLERLKILTMDKLIAFEAFPTDRVDFFSLASLVYRRTPDSDKRFRNYFAFFAPAHIIAMKEPELRKLEEMMNAGGFFARDTFRAQTQAWATKTANAKREAKEELASTPAAKKPNAGGRGRQCRGI